MGKKENEVKKQIADLFNQYGFKWNWRNNVINHKKGFLSGKNGLPDLSSIIWDGKTFYVEAKEPDGKPAIDKLTKEQSEFKDYCLSHDVPYTCTDNVESVDKYLKVYREKLKREGFKI